MRRALAAALLGFVPGVLFGQGNDAAYTQKIKQYTTDPMFLNGVAMTPLSPPAADTWASTKWPPTCFVK